MTTPHVPSAIREAGARALFEHDRAPDEPPWEDLPVHDSESYLNAVNTILTAILGMCEVREQQGLRITWVDDSGGLDESWESRGSGWAHNAVAFHQNALAHNPDYPARATLIRRLIITTPAEPTEGAET